MFNSSVIARKSFIIPQLSCQFSRTPAATRDHRAITRVRTHSADIRATEEVTAVVTEVTADLEVTVVFSPTLVTLGAIITVIAT